MSQISSRQLRLARRPTGRPSPDTWSITEEPCADPGEGEVRVAVRYISVDPAMRGWLNDVRSYSRPVVIGEVMRAQGIGEVIDSRHPGFASGQLVAGRFGVQEHALADGSDLVGVDQGLAPAPTWLGLLGLTGLTAYFGLLDIAHPEPDQVVLVSGAAGAVGSVVGQLAKLRGCRAIGLAGGAEKCAWLRDALGFDAAIDYKSDDVSRRLHEVAPNGIDVYFDNVGGPTLDTALAQLRLGARVVICGAISQYNATGQPYGPRNYLSLLVNRAAMTGMLISDYAERFAEARAQLGDWLAGGQLIAREQIVNGGIERFPDALLMLFDGANTGKLVLGLTRQGTEPTRSPR